VRPTLAILVVDDNPRLCELARWALGADGWDVEVTGSRRAALDVAARRPFALALSDYAMPDGHGLDLLSELERLQPDCCRVLWSAALSTATARRARELGVAVLPGKPLGDELCAAIRSLVKPWERRSGGSATREAGLFG
jgi:two-component system nitrogen regulation response regulator GlnG